jgi:hypothetical protein
LECILRATGSEDARKITALRKVSPPGYWKDRLTNEKELHISIRSDRYYLEPVNEN